jgi:hypothetical protein
MDGEMRSSVTKKVFDEGIEETLRNASLENVPLEQRRREASKPLFLTRYE